MNNYDYNNNELDYNDYLNDESDSEATTDLFNHVAGTSKVTYDEFWELYEQDSVNSSVLEAISGNPFAPADLLDAIGRELINRATQDADLMTFDDEAIENVLNHGNTSEAMKEEVREYLAPAE